MLGNTELIDTLWNVNLPEKIEHIYPDYRINRYIMECKCTILTVITHGIKELIDTLWNVNEKSSSHKCGRKLN